MSRPCPRHHDASGASTCAYPRGQNQFTYQVGDPSELNDYTSLDGSFTCDYVTYVGSTR